MKIERYPHRSFCKVGEQHHDKGHQGFVLILFMRKAFNSSLTQLIKPFPYLVITWACWQNNKMAATNMKWTRRCREDACLAWVKRYQKWHKMIHSVSFSKLLGWKKNWTNVYLKLYRFKWVVPEKIQPPTDGILEILMEGGGQRPWKSRQKGEGLN